MVWSRNKALDEEAIGESLTLAIRINEKAEAVYVDHQDPRLLVIAKKSKEIHERLIAVLLRNFAQREMFETIATTEGGDEDQDTVE